MYIMYMVLNALNSMLEKMIWWHIFVFGIWIGFFEDLYWIFP